MSEYYGYPENDWRNYLMHKAASGSSRSYKYISKHRSKLGNWVYVYPKQTRTKKAGAVLRELDRITERADRNLSKDKETLDWMGSLKPEDFHWSDGSQADDAYEDAYKVYEKRYKDWIDRKTKNDRTKKKRKILSKIFSKGRPR